jgi:tape measure domain-containing protein
MMASSDLAVKLRILLADEGVPQKIARLGASMIGLRREVDRLADSTQTVRQRLGDGMDSISRQLRRIQALGIAIGGLFQGEGLVGGIARTAAEFESLEAAMRVVFGSTEAASSEMDRLRAESERLGVPLETLARSWLAFAAAARGTALEGQQAREVFTALAEASTVLGLSQDQLQGALLALQQMISKGTVSSEELRQQLGERLYGAMQIAARSLGITTQALSDLLERGMIPTGRFLPVSVSSIQSSAGSGETGPSMLRMVDGIAAELGSLALTARGARDNTRGGLARSLPRGICRRPPCVRRGRLAYKPRRVRS